jgi:hypothetical protein
MTPTNPWSLWLDATQLTLDSASVIAMRLSKMTTMDSDAMSEAHLMISEKIATASALHMKALTGQLGNTPGTQAARTLSHYRKAVAKNRRRLSRKDI